MHTLAILQVQDTLEVDLRYVFVVEEAECSGGYREEDRRSGQEQDRAQVGFDSGTRCEDTDWGDCGSL
jgi:hypothetical protein